MAGKGKRGYVGREIMTHMEWIAALLGIVCVALAAVRNVWTFPTGIASVALVGFVVFSARLYSDALLQLFFVAANLDSTDENVAVWHGDEFRVEFADP